MTHGPLVLSGIVADASVLIDYMKADKGVLQLIGRHLATIHIPSPILGEVRELTHSEAGRLGLDVLEPTLQQALQAEAGRGQTSFQDQLCMVVARDSGWACLTNDQALRKVCDEAGVLCVWGLRVMIDMVHKGCLRPDRAVDVARRIAAVNRFITSDILSRFIDQLGK